MNYVNSYTRVSHVSCHSVCVGHKYDNFVVGLSNSNPISSPPTPFKYEVCGRYSGVSSPRGQTVSVYCRDCLQSFRYVIVQLPLHDHLVACEVEVLVRGTLNVEYQYSDIYLSSSQLFNVVISAICR